MAKVCSVKGCRRKEWNKRLCLEHFLNLLDAMDKETDAGPAVVVQTICSKKDCGRRVHACGYCKSHYEYERRLKQKVLRKR